MKTNLDEGDLLLRVSGIVPASEFHPFIVLLARRLRLRGWIRHDASGALIRAVGTENQLVQLVRAIRDDAPATARVRSMDPELITVDTPPVGDGFVPLVEEEVGHTPSSEHPLVNVA